SSRWGGLCIIAIILQVGEIEASVHADAVLRRMEHGREHARHQHIGLRTAAHGTPPEAARPASRWAARRQAGDRRARMTIECAEDAGTDTAVKGPDDGGRFHWDVPETHATAPQRGSVARL